MTARAAGVTPPQQDRSRRTAERIGKAMMRLLAEKPLQEIGIAELCRRARTSVGSFYARFADKTAVLVWLEENYFAASQAEMAGALRPERWEGVPLVTMIRELLTTYVRFLREHAPVLRAVALENRLRPESAVARRSRALNQHSYQGFAALVLARRGEIGHPDPAFAVRFGLTAVYATSHELLLFADTGLHPNGMRDDEIAAALTDLYLRILDVSSTQGIEP